MSLILGIDDLRIMPYCTEVARTSEAGLTLLARYRHMSIDELWLDHDLGGDDTIRPVAAALEEAAFNGEPFDIGTIFIHSSNPSGAEYIMRGLLRWGYNVQRVSAPQFGTITE